MNKKEYKERMQETGSTQELKEYTKKTILGDLMAENYIEIKENKHGFVVSQAGMAIEVFSNPFEARQLAAELSGYDDTEGED